MAKVWAKSGFTVHIFIGTDHYIPADILIVHVDLSVVPESYFNFAARFPTVLNGHVKDIRKSVTSAYLVKPGDGYNGQVMVKSNLNCGGTPEELFTTEPSPVVRNIDDPLRGYKIYESIDRVPSEILDSSDWVVERFLPQEENGVYYNNCYMFMDDAEFCARFESPRTE